LSLRYARYLQLLPRRGAEAAGAGGQLPRPLPLLHGGSAGAEKCPFAMQVNESIDLRRGLIKKAGQEFAIFRQTPKISHRILTDSCKCPTEETTGAQNFNFDPKFPQNKSSSASKFAFFNEKILTRRRFSDSPKFRGVPQATTPLIALKYESASLPFVVSGAPASAMALKLLNKTFYVHGVYSAGV